MDRRVRFGKDMDMARADQLRVVKSNGEHTSSTAVHLVMEGHRIQMAEHLFKIDPAEWFRYAYVGVKAESDVEVEYWEEDVWRIKFGGGLVLNVDDATMRALGAAIEDRS